MAKRAGACKGLFGGAGVMCEVGWRERWGGEVVAADESAVERGGKLEDV